MPRWAQGCGCVSVCPSDAAGVSVCPSNAAGLSHPTVCLWLAGSSALPREEEAVSSKLG